MIAPRRMAARHHDADEDEIAHRGPLPPGRRGIQEGGEDEEKLRRPMASTSQNASRRGSSRLCAAAGRPGPVRFSVSPAAS